MKVFAVVLVAVACAYLFEWARRRWGSASPRQRLLFHLKSRADYIVIIGMPLQTPARWVQASSYTPEDLSVEGQSIPPQHVSSYIVAYPNGQVLDSAGEFHPLPPGLTFLQRRAAVGRVVLDPTLLAGGARFATVSFGPCMGARDDRTNYSTTLRNVGTCAFRVTRFGGFSLSGWAYVLNNVSGDYYTDKEFISWYGVLEDGWILPGACVTDWNNYGDGDGYWVYYCVTREGQEFVVGGKTTVVP